MSRTRFVLCLGPYCNLDRRARPLYDQLVAAVDVLNGDQFPGPYKLETANCLSMCGAGPNLMIYPQAQPVHNLDADKLRRVLAAFTEDTDDAGR
jgi:(2Fe-2S) ferredoxin